MRRHARRLVAAFIFISLPLATVLTRAQGATTLPGAGPGTAVQSVDTSASGLQLDAFDRRVDPCTDFYQFACGGWAAANPIPPDRPRWGRFDELQERNDTLLRTVLEEAASGQDPSSKKIGDYYATCMDEDTIERRGATPLDPDLRNIAALTNVARLPELLAELHKIGVNAFFGFSAEGDFKDASTVMAIAGQGGLGLPDRDYFLKDDAKSAELRTRYAEHVARLLALAGSASNRAATDAATVIRVETTLAFQKAFSCPDSSAMVAKNACRVW